MSRVSQAKFQIVFFIFALGTICGAAGALANSPVVPDATVPATGDDSASSFSGSFLLGLQSDWFSAPGAAVSPLGGFEFGRQFTTDGQNAFFGRNPLFGVQLEVVYAARLMALVAAGGSLDLFRGVPLKAGLYLGVRLYEQFQLLVRIDTRYEFKISEWVISPGLRLDAAPGAWAVSGGLRVGTGFFK